MLFFNCVLFSKLDTLVPGYRMVLPPDYRVWQNNWDLFIFNQTFQVKIFMTKKISDYIQIKSQKIWTQILLNLITNIEYKKEKDIWESWPTSLYFKENGIKISENTLAQFWTPPTKAYGSIIQKWFYHSLFVSLL